MSPPGRRPYLHEDSGPARFHPRDSWKPPPSHSSKRRPVSGSPTSSRRRSSGSCSALCLLVLFIGNTTQTAENVKDGLSVGLIWALIALGYTLVYGIIELINFAHGEVFMIGAFVSVSLFGAFGITPGTSTAADHDRRSSRCC